MYSSWELHTSECTRSNVKESKIQKFPGGISQTSRDTVCLLTQIFILLPPYFYETFFAPLSHFLTECLITGAFQLTVKDNLSLSNTSQNKEWMYWYKNTHFCSFFKNKTAYTFIAPSVMSLQRKIVSHIQSNQFLSQALLLAKWLIFVQCKCVWKISYTNI